MTAATICRRGHDDWKIDKHGRYCRTCKNTTRQIKRGTAPKPPKVFIENDAIRLLVQDAVKRDPDLTIEIIADRMGWNFVRGPRTFGDERRLTRVLGMRSYFEPKTGKTLHQRHISEENAVKIGRAIHIDPWELGL